MNLTVRAAQEQDIPHILSLIDPYVQKGIVLPRTYEEILQALDCFMIAEYTHETLGVISYYNYGEELKEIRTLVVSERSQGLGVGSALVKALLQKLKTKESTRIFTLTYSPIFFEKNGFSIVDKELLPEKIWKDCNKCKNRESCGETALLFQG